MNVIRKLQGYEWECHRTLDGCEKLSRVWRTVSEVIPRRPNPSYRDRPVPYPRVRGKGAGGLRAPRSIVQGARAGKRKTIRGHLPTLERTERSAKT